MWRVVHPVVPRRFEYLLYPGNDRRLGWLFGAPQYHALRREVARHELGPDAFLETYWLGSEVPGEEGPVAVLVVHGREVLKFDCYGPGFGHFHFSKSRPRGRLHGLHGRFFFREASVAEQIERSRFELETNLGLYLSCDASARVRRTRIDPDRLAEGSRWMGARMRALEERHRPTAAPAPTNHVGGSGRP